MGAPRSYVWCLTIRSEFQRQCRQWVPSRLQSFLPILDRESSAYIVLRWLDRGVA